MKKSMILFVCILILITFPCSACSTTPKDPTASCGDLQEKLIFIKNGLYRSTENELATVPNSETILGEITSSTEPDQTPAIEGQSNFNCIGAPYACTESGMAVKEADTWIFYELVSGDPYVPPRSVQYESHAAKMEIQLPDGWDYEIIEHTDENPDPFGIRFWPKNEKDGSMDLFYYPDFFAVCGTGLNSETIHFSSGLSANMGTYDNDNFPSFISFSDLPGDYVVTPRGSAFEWYSEYQDEILKILDTAKLGIESISLEDAIKIAKTDYTEKYDYTYANFDFEAEAWTVYFELEDSDTRAWRRVSPDGNLLR